MSSPQKLKISVRKTKKIQNRICQGDIFSDIEVIENIEIKGSKIVVKKLYFPFIICLNQECDLERDYEKKYISGVLSDTNLLHLAIAPAFIFDQFLNGSQWGDIFSASKTARRTDTKIDLIMNNEIPRYHYLKFSEEGMPELIIDFKHFFTINRDLLYDNLSNRLCSLDDLYKEKISQRFSYFLSRIALPDFVKEEILLPR
jgi:hypothetical protein